MTDLAVELKQLRLFGMASSYVEVMENSAGTGVDLEQALNAELKALAAAVQASRT